ncbi:ROK family protein, partial [Mycobacterium tuberculosis]|nr:ROK family protein [Mycobacterium tuberculosis]
LYPDGEPCGCGNRGCFEAHGSGTALVREGRRAYAATGLLPAGVDRLDDINGRVLTAAARAGDPVAQAVLEREAAILG